ncbi:tRNA-queuosine alpha-mannosyltransferase domain-containing protein [Litorilituus lipolyticus]|uniref:tRNA-queuosine alpha-mannosyltransferase n=1 Tax=Litorilituus lipolyticus TaxID=2491017 RepID=A0A502L3L5_9GAMM|nr:DUF3524 domain-containing protein [Litorilituus lipolyticus]TPH18548.1 DUF3524 domain-containing protein [Litorilituus lipolyticus]
MRILLLSAYDAASHQYWRQSLVSQFPEHDFTALTLPARFFSWRIRGNSLTWAYSQRPVLEQGYDLIIATSMTDLSSLKGFVPALVNIPAIVYFHENQFAYPKSGKEFNSVEPQILSLYTALAGDTVVFNTEYNKRTFLQGCQQLLKKLPDQVPKNIIDILTDRSQVIPVPLLPSSFLQNKVTSGKLQIIWNHRWEFDKGPKLLLDAMLYLKQQGVDFTLHVVGECFRQVPEVFTRIKAQLFEHIGVWGYIEDKVQYQQLLQASDIVLSTALHDFQGISVLEAVAAGCLPVVPNRLAYPELFAPEYCYDDNENELANLTTMIITIAKQKEQRNLKLAPCVSHFSWETQRNHYRKLINNSGSKTHLK